MSTKKFLNTVVTIAAPPAHVWTIMCDVEKWHLWTLSIRKIKCLDKGPFGVGTKVLISQPKFPPALWRVTAVEHGRGFTWVSSGPGVRVTAKHLIEPVSGGSKVTLSVHYEGIFASLFYRLIGTITERYVGFEAAGLKKQSESTYVV